ncbi:hypothetical protein [Tautonia plasticadhaerens]|uniref:Uncharacterized protein n=1 Tax=Tautonia plasticadhaerens TaxID=2527974 RepID=A0A518GZC1_9BACT|nr:hypothetical protein [Tautonia plasticadhaerens]QDV33941.1 hypothetical protein ElP_18220 [Tautonia plasticadhaerens]
MIRTGYLRWEIEAADGRSEADRRAHEVVLRARPTYRTVRIQGAMQEEAAERFVRGEAAYAAVLQAVERPGAEVEVRVPDVGPHVFRYTSSDREKNLGFWVAKLHREVEAFAHEVVRVAGGFPRLVIANPALRAGYAKLVEHETFRVIEGKSVPEPTREDEAMILDAAAFAQGVPELVAAQLVRDVVEPREFDEFSRDDRITIRNGTRIFRISRKPHALIEVWKADTYTGEARLCVVFQDPGMPPSDEVVMKYLLAKHQPDLLWKVGVRFPAPTGRFDAPVPRRWHPA